MNHHLGQKFFTFIRRVTDIQVVDHGLVQQLHLRTKLGNSLYRHQFLRLVLKGCPGRIDNRKDGRNIVDNLRAVRGIINIEVANDINQHLQLFRTARDFFFDLASIADLGQLADATRLLLELLLVRLQRIIP